MLYRKSLSKPTRLLLRITGATTVMGVVACGSVSGVVPDAGHEGDASDESIGPCGGGVCGSVALPADAGEEADAALGCGHGGVCGVIAMPPDAGGQ